ncbi:Mur ligase [Scleroderma yunnanense]
MSIDLTLERIGHLANQFPYTRPTIHVAGTNGKGSVTSLLASILRASALKVGKFNSPHLVSVYDCITINDERVTPELYHSCRTQVECADEECNSGASSFELLTVTALVIFEKANVDVAVIEVGMGGRLDATNVLPDHCILASALTTVDLDHQTILGDTVELIAREKAAIARGGKPFILGPQKHSSVRSNVEEIVLRRSGVIIPSIPVKPWAGGVDHSPHSLSARPFVPPLGQPIEFASDAFTSPVRAILPLYGAHQLDNLSVALTVISTLLTHPSSFTLLSRDHLRGITIETVRTGIENTSWPGRLSFHTLPHPITLASTRDPLVVLVDGAHNPASAEALASYISSVAMHGQSCVQMLHITYILALSHSPPKTPLQTLSPLLSLHSPSGSATVSVGVLRFTPPEGMPWVKSVSPSVLRDTVVGLSPHTHVWVAQDDAPLDGQLQQALEWAESQTSKCQDEGREHLVVLAGSLYLVADFYRLIERLVASTFQA